MSFPLDILGCNVHSILDVIKGFHRVKDCEDNPPIATPDPSDELTAFEKTEISPPGWLLAKCCWSNFAISEIHLGYFWKISLLVKYFANSEFLQFSVSGKTILT